MQQLREKHDEALNATKNNGTTETIKELDKLRQTLEEKRGDVMEIGEERNMLMEQLTVLNQSFNEERGNHRKEPKPPNYYQEN